MRNNTDSILHLLFHNWLIPSVLLKWLTTTLTQTEKLRTDLYIIGINFSKITHPRVWKCTLKGGKKKGFSFLQNDKKSFFGVNVEKVIQIYRNNWIMTMNCVSKAEVHRELFHGFQNFMKVGTTERPADRQVIKNTEFENRTLIYLSHTAFFISLSRSCTIQQSISNKRLGMRRTKTPLMLVSFQFREWNCLGIGLG